LYKAIVKYPDGPCHHVRSLAPRDSLRSAKSAGLPIEQAKFDLVVNWSPKRCSV